MTVQFAGVPELPPVTPPGGGPPVPQLDVISTSQPVDSSGNFSLQDLNEIDLVGQSVSAGTTNCSANEISSGIVTVSAIDNTLGVIATTTIPASYWCEDNQSQLGAGCFPTPVATITLSDLSFATTGFNLLNCGSPANPANPQFINDEDANGNIVLTCAPTPNGDGSYSTTPVTQQEEVSCGDGHGALIQVSCNGTGNVNDISISGSVALSIESSCGSGQPGNNTSTRTFTDLVPGASQSTPNALQSCDVFSNICATGMPCLFNDFQGNATVVNLRP